MSTKAQMSSRYRHDPDDPARINKHGGKEWTRQPRSGNRLYCLVWTDHDLFKVGLSSKKSNRDTAAIRSLGKYFKHDQIASCKGWRTELPGLDGEEWGDCQRFEMVAAAAVRKRLNAKSAGAVGLEWFFREELDRVSWEAELTSATKDALEFSGFKSQVAWTEYTPTVAAGVSGGPALIHGSSQRDAWRTMRNERGQCALKGCGAAVITQAAPPDGFLYCSDAHATADRDQRATDARATVLRRPVATKTTIRGLVKGSPERLTWEDGAIDGTPEARAQLLELKGDVRAGPQWPTVTNPDPRRHLDFVVCALRVLGTDASVEGDLPKLRPVRQGGVQ